VARIEKQVATALASPLIGAPSYPLRQRPRQGRTAGGLDQGPL